MDFLKDTEMTAFIQKLFRKRNTTEVAKKAGSQKASSPHSGTPSPDSAPRQAALQAQERIDQQRASLTGELSQETLADLAVHGLAADIRLEAAQALVDRQWLTHVQKHTRGKDKGVYQTVRQTLQTLRDQEDREAALQQEIAEAVKLAEELAKTSDMALYDARLANLESHWAGVSDKAGKEQTTAYLESLRLCHQRARELAEQKQSEAFHRRQAEQRQQTLSLLDDSLDQLQDQLPDTAALPSLDGLLRTQENRWLEATRDTDVDKAEQKRYEDLMRPFRSYVSALKRLDEAADTLASLAAETDNTEADSAAQLLSELDWPRDFRKPAAVTQLEKRVKQSLRPEATPAAPAADPQAGQAIKALLDQLESALEADRLKESRQRLKQAHDLHRTLDRHTANRTRSRLQRLAAGVRELEDWQGFATKPKQVSLCEQMEYLAEQPMEPEAKAGHIQELQQEWRELGGSSDRALWQRFKTASDRAFEPCKAYFEAKAGLKQINLQKRITLCEELDAFLTTTDWQTPDWKLADKVEKAAREDWRNAWPVEFRDNRQVQKRFDRLMEQLGDHLNEERTRNEASKADIVLRAEALVEREPLSEAMAEAKTLQQEWQSIGITHHKEDRRLWKAFRQACDRIFERRKEEKQVLQAQETAASQQARELISQALSASAGSAEELDRLTGSLKTALADSPSGKVRRELNEALEHLQQQRATLARQQQAATWIALIEQRREGPLSDARIPEDWSRLAGHAQARSAEDLVILAEILTGTASPEDARERRMELQIHRLAQGLGGHEEPEDSLESLVAQWCVGLPDSPRPRELEQRLVAALNS